MASTLEITTNTPPINKDITTPSRVSFQPSKNWKALRKSLPQESSKKRKRASKPTPTPAITKKTETTLTTYNPWRPNDSRPRKSGNPALLDSSISGDKLKYSPRGEFAHIDAVGMLRLIVR